MLKQFVKNTVKHTAIFGFGDISKKFLGLLLLPIYLKFLTPAEYGVLSLLGILSFFCSVSILQGIPTSAFKFINHSYINDHKAQREVLGSSYIYLMVSSLVFFSICYFFSSVISTLLFSSGDYSYIIKLSLVSNFFSTVNMIPFVCFRAYLQSVRSITLSLISFIVNAIINIYFVVYLEMGIEGIVLGGLITSGVIFIVTPFLIWKNISLKLSSGKVKELLLFGWPLIPAGYGQFVLSSMDRYCLEHLSSRNELGLYALGFSIASAITFLFLGPFQKTWPAVFFPLAEKEDATNLFGRFFTYFIFVGFSFSLFIIYMSQSLIMVIAPKTYNSAYYVVPFLVVSLLLTGLQPLLTVGIQLKKQTKYFPLITFVGVIFNVGLNLILIPFYGMIGAAVATLISSFIMVLTCVYLNNIFYRINYEFRRILCLSVIFIVFILVDKIIPYAFISNCINVNYIYKDAIIYILIKLAILFLAFLYILKNFFNTQELIEMNNNVGNFPVLGKIIKRFSSVPFILDDQ